MRPLLFLLSRSLKNGLVRSLRSPVRLIGILLFILSQFPWILNTLGRRQGRPIAFPIKQYLTAPPLQTIELVVFSIMLVLTAFQGLGLVLHRANYRAADADVLFATPISARTVLGFRIIAEYLAQLVLPVILILVANRLGDATWTQLLKGLDRPEGAGVLMRNGYIAFVALAVMWVHWGWAVSLVLHQPGRKWDVRLRLAGWFVPAWAAAVLVVPLAVFYTYGTLDAVAGALTSPVLRAAYFPASLATTFVMSPISPDQGQGAFSLAAILALSATGLWFALRCSSLLYDQAALRAYEVTRVMAAARSEGLAYYSLEKARSGRVKVRGTNWLNAIRVSGPMALIWKEAVVFSRSGWRTTVSIALFVSGLLVLMALLVQSTRSGRSELLILPLVACGPFACSLSVVQGALPDSLSRIDLVKPLPFTPTRLILLDCLARMIPATVGGVIPCITCIAVRPNLAVTAVPTMLAALSALFAISCASLPGAVLLPDHRDPSQRMLRGLLGLPIVGVAILPGVGVVAAVLALKGTLGVALLASVAPTVLLALLAVGLAGHLYAGFNPADP